MKTIKPSQNRNHQKVVNSEKKSSGMLRLFSIIMLLLMVLTSLGRIATANNHTPPGGQTPTQQLASSRGGGTSARILVFHREDKEAGLCEDLMITASGTAIYSTCKNTIEKQYTLNETERQQLQTWIMNFQAVNYDRSAASQAAGTVIQLYLNGQGSQKATDFETQQIIDFAAAVEAKITSQS